MLDTCHHPRCKKKHTRQLITDYLESKEKGQIDPILYHRLFHQRYDDISRIAGRTDDRVLRTLAGITKDEK